MFFGERRGWVSADVAGICELFDWKSVMLHDDWRFRNYPVFASFAKVNCPIERRMWVSF